MTCLASIDAGSREAQKELIFLYGLLIDLTRGVEPKPDISGVLAFTDVYRHPAFGADNFIQLHKPSERFLELTSRKETA